MKAINDRTISLILFLWVMFFSGCSFSHTKIVFSKPSIENSKKWELKEECGYEGCYPLVDFIEGEDVRIRIDVSKGERAKGAFTITLEFITSGQKSLTISPSKIYVEFLGGGKVFAKPFKCGSEDFRKYLQETDYIKKTNDFSLKHFNFYKYYRDIATPMPDTISIEDSYPGGKLSKCVELFFDTSPPSEDDVFHLVIQGVEESGFEIRIPSITFNPSFAYTPKRQGRPINKQ